jgi:hypothetical protein
MARLHGLDEGWLNDGVKGFLPGPDVQAGALLDLPGLAVVVALHVRETASADVAVLEGNGLGYEGRPQCLRLSRSWQ